MEKVQPVPLSHIVHQMGFQIVYQSRDYEQITIHSENVNRPGLQLAGFYDLFDHDRIQLIGLIETAYLKGFPYEERKAKFETLMKKKIPALIICHDVDPMPEWVEMARKHDITLLKTDIATSDMTTKLIRTIQSDLAPRITRHGVFVEIYGEGVLLMGESGVGKSEAAIELIKRGHRLIADDAVEIKRVAANSLIGTAPELIRYYIELRGIGVVDVRRIFGSGSVKLNEKINLVVNLVSWTDDEYNYDRLGVEEHFTEILGVSVPSITIPIKPGRNLAVILEVAAMNNKLKKMGHNSAKEFTEQISNNLGASVLKDSSISMPLNLVEQTEKEPI